ncbi:nucleotide exchange factor GrpE [Desulfovibrio piger]|uniref:nucleotide exchange factor GrpE n=1 Tax=Desulfovibrio piger TaxID=901 RepID=UPI0026F2108E|nr:nucleotide exchange factor GrpE [Desulfovibrio piger]
MHMKDTQNTEAQEEACAEAEAGDAGSAVQALPENLESLCREHVCPNCTEKRDAEDARLRAAAEMDNFKKRLKREHEEQIRYAAEKVMSDLLPTLDNLDLALQYGSKDEACRDMLQGVAMTRKLLLEAVARHGLTAVGTAGEAFTPELHEAVGFDAEADVEAGAVARVLQSGYKLGERLLRPAKVMIKQG